MNNTKRVATQGVLNTDCPVTQFVLFDTIRVMSDGKDPVAVEQGRRLRHARKAKGWVREHLAERTGWSPEHEERGFSPSRIGNYEQGLRRIGYEEADLFATVFPEYPSAYFLGVVDEREAKMLVVMRTHPDPDRQVIT